MKKIAIFTAIAAASLATPVLANEGFTGVRAEVTAGYNDITSSTDANDVNYGAAVGIDLPIGSNFTIGVEANTANVFQRERQVGAAARAGYTVTKTTMVYGLAGYTNYQDVTSKSLDGVVVGAGIEQKISPRTYLKVQYDYSDFARGVGQHAVKAGIGLHF